MKSVANINDGGIINEKEELPQKGLSPNISDINSLLYNKNAVGITVGHNDSVYYYSQPKSEISNDDRNIAMRRFNKFSEITSMEKALNLLSKKYGFTIELL